VTELGPTRRRVLATLQDSPTPLGAADVAQRLGVHPNSARFHLDALVAAGMAGRASAERDAPGRPTILYAASASAPSVAPRGYRSLAEILVGHLAAQRSPSTAAAAAGEQWGRGLARSGAAGPPPRSRAAAARAVVDGLAGVGFDATMASRGARVEIHPCPFLELVQSHGALVCAVHRGLMTGLLDELDAPVTVGALVPFVAPDRCEATLTAAR
jgi:predicted ArsR family transcriptional regulator